MTSLEWKTPIFEFKDSDFNGSKYIGNTPFKKGYGMVLMYANWCGHCISLHPKYQDFAKQVSGFFNVAVIESNEEKYKENMNTHGFPTIYIYKNGNYINETYDGPREVDALVEKAKSLNSS